MTENHISKLEKHIEHATSNMKYSSDRFDILIISISSGGLVFSMGFIKDFSTTKSEIDFTLLIISWICFSSSIIFNLISQVTGYYANKYDIRVTRNIIREEKMKDIKGNQKKLILLETIMNESTMILNATSLISLIAGIVLMTIFSSINL